jgi:hypothetical protein
MSNVQSVPAVPPAESIPLGQAISRSFAFISVAWRNAWGAMLILVWLSAVLQMIEAMKPEWTAAPLLGLIFLLAASTVATGALYRIGLEPDHAGDSAFALGPGGVQWGALEWRVLGANLLLGLALSVLFVVLFIIWGVGLGVSMAGHPEALQAVTNATSNEDKLRAFGALMGGAAGVVTLVVLLPGLLAILYLAARLALFTLNAADTRSFDFGKAWTMTRGAVLALIVVSVLIYLAQILLGGLCGAVAGFLSAFLDPGKGGMWGGIVGQAAGAAISAPLFAGLQLFIYHRRRGEGRIAATFA